MKQIFVITQEERDTGYRSVYMVFATLEKAQRWLVKHNNAAAVTDIIYKNDTTTFTIERFPLYP